MLLIKRCSQVLVLVYDTNTPLFRGVGAREES